MPLPDPIFVAHIADAFARSDAAANNYDRGIELEELIKFVLGKIDGIKHWRSRVLNDAGSAEYDVCFTNDQRISPVYNLGHILIVECKNTSAKVTSPALRIFASKLQDARAEWGILVAAYGITGSGERSSRAHDVIKECRGLGINVLVVTRDDLLALSHPSEVATLLIDKIMSHSLMTSIF